MPTVEPFFLRCETCRARLRVRDERFLGQVQSCPKCGSMVQIIAPAGWLAASDAAAAPQESVPVDRGGSNCRGIDCFGVAAPKSDRTLVGGRCGGVDRWRTGRDAGTRRRGRSRDCADDAAGRGSCASRSAEEDN